MLSNIVLATSSIEWFKEIYPEAKFWSSLVGGLWLVFKGLTWVKEIKTKDLAAIKEGVAEVKNGLNNIHNEMKGQTVSIVDELRELRADFRAYQVPAVRVAARKRNKK
jgi:hypothetical protein